MFDSVKENGKDKIKKKNCFYNYMSCQESNSTFSKNVIFQERLKTNFGPSLSYSTDLMNI